MENKFERAGEVLTAIMGLFCLIWLGGLFVGAGKLDWWAGSLMIILIAYFIIMIIGGCIKDFLTNRNKRIYYDR